MKAKLYAYAHLEAARKLFPERAAQEGWLEEQWKDEEINACKLLEMNDFITSPSLATYPIKDMCSSAALMPEDFSIANELLANNKNLRTCLSIGCGLGQKELMLAKSNPQVSFVAIDNAPYVESLNSIAVELKLTNIVFKNVDLRNVNLGKFDVVYSFAVIYCIPDESLADYFKLIMNTLNPKGWALVGCSANYSLKSKIVNLIRFIFPKLKRKNVKQTGWLRDIRHVKKFIPKQVTIEDLYKFEYFSGKKSGGVYSTRHAIEIFQKHIFPISNRSYMFVLRN